MLELDQAKTLREIMDNGFSTRLGAGRSMRVISVTSGKGGVGKSTVVTNLAVELGKLDQKVLVMDGDFGLANLDIMMDVRAKYTLHDVLFKNCSIRDVIVEAAHNVDIIPASSGIYEMSNLGLEEKSKLLDFMQEIENQYDVLIIDTGAGINSDVTWLNASAAEVLVVSTPEPTAITDAYALIKVLNQKFKVKNFKLLVNQTRDDTEGLKVYQKITSVSDRFLNVGIDYVGHISWDDSASQAIRMRKPLVQAYPGTKVAKNFTTIADNLSNCSERVCSSGSPQFFWKALLGHA